MSKGSKRRPTLISRELEDLRWALASGKISFEDYSRKLHELRKKGLA